MNNFNMTPKQPSNGLTVLELFCGGGLGAIGFKSAGYEIVKALDIDKNAVKAYHHNFGDYVEQADINEIDIDSLPDTDVIFGGPPCQDFSISGKGAGADGERGKLVWRYLEIIERKQPKAFVFENVKGLIAKRHRLTFDALIEKFNEIGYQISWRIMNAWHYGVAQKRERVFIVGIRKNLGFTFKFPKPLEGDYQTQVLKNVIGDLPEPAAFPNHMGTKTKFRDGKTQGDKVYPLKSPSPTIRAEHHGNIEGFDTSEKTNGSESGLRRFTVRECLRIQSVPDSYIIPYDIPMSAGYRIVGNGIASRVAWYIGCALAVQLRFKSKA